MPTTTPPHAAHPDAPAPPQGQGAAPAAKSGKPTWLRLYHALGGFSVLSVLAAVGLNAALLHTYRSSVDEAQVWAQRAASYTALGQLATVANGPGNNVFESGDLVGERARLDAAMTTYRSRRDAARAELSSGVPTRIAGPLLAELDEADRHVLEIEQASIGVFTALGRGDRDAAGSEMARMDRALGEASGHLAALQGEVQQVQERTFAAQLGRADKLQMGAYGIVVLVGLMVAGVAAYGRRLAAVFAAANAEIERRRGEVTLLLGNIDQGLVTVGADGTMSLERSAAFSRLFGPPAPSGRFDEQLAAVSADAALWWEIGWSSLVEGLMPDELLVTQLPQGFEREGAHIALSYRVLRQDGVLQGVLVIATDVTAAREREAAEQAQRETLALFDRVARDRVGVIEFLADADRIVRTLSAATEDSATEKRLLHTLKGTSGFYGLSSVTEAVHQLETEVVERDTPLTTEERAALALTWERVRSSAGRMLGEHGPGRIEIGDHELQDLLRAVLDRRPHAEIAQRIAALKLEPVARRLERLGAQATALCQRLGKPAPEVHITTSDARTDPTVTAAFWGSLVHVIRNAIDHAYEGEEARAAAGKPAALQLHLRAAIDGDALLVEIEEDGAGIDWERLRSKAKAASVRALRPQDNVELLFLDGISSRDEVSELSGRGVGMGAVRAEVHALGGEIEVDSVRGRGTRFTFRLPADRCAQALTTGAIAV
ncbi:MAG: hypothetical protein RL071_3495 [Pseudomonadota bacterium]